MEKQQTIKEREEEILRNSLRNLNDSKRILDNTMVELDRQGDSLVRIEHNISHLNDCAKESNLITNQISSFWSGVTGMFKPKQRPTDPSKITRGLVPEIQTTTNISQSGDVLDELNKSLLEIKHSGILMSHELDNQNKALDRISDGVTGAETRIASADKKLKKSLR